MKIRLKAPEGTESINVAGENLAVDKDGCVEVEQAQVADLVSGHGFKPVASVPTPVKKDKPAAADKDKK